MNPMELEALLGPATMVTPQDALQSLLLALLLGLAIAALSRFSKLESNASPSMLSTLVLLAPIGALVMLVIGNSLARAFSLVGALAIIRFRTRLRSPWDITLVFLTLAVGVGCGVGAHAVSIIGTIVVALAVALVGALPGTRPSLDIYQLRCDVSAHQVGATELEPVLADYVAEKSLSEARTSRFGQAMALTWRIELKRGARIEDLLAKLSAVEGVERATLLTAREGMGEEA